MRALVTRLKRLECVTPRACVVCGFGGGVVTFAKIVIRRTTDPPLEPQRGPSHCHACGRRFMTFPQLKLRRCGERIGAC